jgi:hypothetical protein
MLKMILFIILSMGSVAYATEPQDIVAKSRLDQQSSASFINRIRTFLINNNFKDPYNRTLEAPVVVDFNQVLDELPENTQSWIKELQAILNLKLFESSYKLRIEEFSYTIEGFNSELKPLQSSLNRIDYVTLNYVQGLRLAASKIIFEVELNRTSSGSPITFEIELLRPEFILSPELLVELPMGWHTAIFPDSLLLSLHTIDLSKVFAKVAENPELIGFNVDAFKIPQVSIRIGGKTINFDREKIKKFMMVRKENMKMAIIDLLQTRMQERFSNIIKDRPQEMFIPKTFSTKGIINTVFDLKSLEADSTTNILAGTLAGHFCANENDYAYDRCRTNQLPTKKRREIDSATFDQSMREIDLLFMQKRANIAISISEHYINQLISAAAQAGILQLGGDGFSLGSEKAFILAEEKGEGFNLYLDIIHKLSGAQRVLVGRSELRFPVRLKIGLKINLVETTPRLQIKVLELKTDEDLLLKGAPQYGLTTNVNTVRFRKKVLQGIMDDIQPFYQKVLVDLELKEFKGTYLEELSFISDGKGRANAILFMNDQK